MTLYFEGLQSSDQSL